MRRVHARQAWVGGLLSLMLAACANSQVGQDAAQQDALAGRLQPLAGSDSGLVCERSAQAIEATLVLDISEGMRPRLAALRDHLGVFWGRLEQLTTAPRVRLVVFADTHLVIDDCRAFTELEALRTELDRWVAESAGDMQPTDDPVINTDCEDNALDALHAAASCSWDASATRVLFLLTDDTFGAQGDELGTGFRIWKMHDTSAITVAHSYAEVLERLSAERVSVMAFGVDGTRDACRVATEPVDTGVGLFSGYEGLQSLPVATGGRAVDLRSTDAAPAALATEMAEQLAALRCAPIQS